MNHLSYLLKIVFVITTFLTTFLLYRNGKKYPVFIIFIIVWLSIQSILSLSGFYLKTDVFPPRIAYLFLPVLVIIGAIFLSPAGRRYVRQLDPGKLVMISIIRIPVELVLYGLYIEKKVPALMTFVGGNYDILSGLTAPFVFYFAYIRNKINSKFVLIWNLICTGLLIAVVRHAILSTPSPFQKYAFDQPNTAILHFPYVWLPACDVPIVLFSHLALFYIILSGTNKNQHPV